jgi:hypothetical protein
MEAIRVFMEAQEVWARQISMKLYESHFQSNLLDSKQIVDYRIMFLVDFQMN